MLSKLKELIRWQAPSCCQWPDGEYHIWFNGTRPLCFNHEPAKPTLQIHPEGSSLEKAVKFRFCPSYRGYFIGCFGDDLDGTAMGLHAERDGSIILISGNDTTFFSIWQVEKGRLESTKITLCNSRCPEIFLAPDKDSIGLKLSDTPFRWIVKPVPVGGIEIGEGSRPDKENTIWAPWMGFSTFISRDESQM